MNHELVGATEEDLGRQVPTKLATAGALDGDGLKRKLLPTGRHIAAAFLAGHNENLAGGDAKFECHEEPSIGEQGAKVYSPLWIVRLAEVRHQ